jgi:hypothetical protein
MAKLAVVMAIVAAAGCAAPCDCGPLYRVPSVRLTPTDLTSATQVSQTPVGASVYTGAYSDRLGMLAAVGTALKIVPEGATDPVDCEVVGPSAGNSDGLVEVRPKQPLQQVWHRLSLDLGSIPAGVAVQGPTTIRFHPGHKPTVSKVELCVKIGTGSGGQIVDHIFDFGFSEPISAGSGSVTATLQVTAPASVTGSCEWSSDPEPGARFTFMCHQYAPTDIFHVALAPGLVSADGSPVTTFSGQTSFEGSLGPPSGTAVCTDLQL